MQSKSGVIAAVLAVITFVTGPQHPSSVSVARAGCEAGDRINSSTMAEATRTLQTQGYTHVRDLKKGCDNFWYGYASKDGREQHVSISPTGEVQLQHE